MRKNLKLVLSLLLLLVATMFVFSCEDESDDTPLDYNFIDPDYNGWNDEQNSRSPFYGIENQRIITPIVAASGSESETTDGAERDLIEYDDKGRVIRVLEMEYDGGTYDVDNDIQYSFGSESGDTADGTSKIYDTAGNQIGGGAQTYAIIDGKWRITMDEQTYTTGRDQVIEKWEYSAKGRPTSYVKIKAGREVKKTVTVYDSATNLIKTEIEYEVDEDSGTLERVSDSDYIIQDGKIVSIKYTSGSEVTDYTITYDENGYVWKYVAVNSSDGTTNVEMALGKQGVPKTITYTGVTNEVETFEYDSKNRETKKVTTKNGVTDEVKYYTYDKDGWEHSAK